MAHSLQSLKEILSDLTDNHYWPPPENSKMQYPCVILEFEDLDTKHADNQPYVLTSKYKVTVIDHESEGSLMKAVAALPSAKLQQHLVADKLYHDVFIIF